MKTRWDNMHAKFFACSLAHREGFAQLEYFIINVSLTRFKVGGLRVPCVSGSGEIPFSARSSPLCCLSPMLRCQSPTDKCTKQFWVPTTTTSPSCLDPPWHGELPGGSLAGWLLSLAAAQSDLTRVIAALPNCWRDDHSIWPSHPCRIPNRVGKAAERVDYKLYFFKNDIVCW